MDHPDGPERMVDIVSTISVVAVVLADLVMKLASAPADEISRLADDVKKSTKLVVECCTDTAENLSPEVAATLRTELAQLAETLQAQIAGIIDLRLAQLAGDGTSRTPH
jgi:hypothetical protein